MAVYTDSLQNGWSDWGWATHNYANTTPVHSGANSVSVTAGGYEALYIARAAFNSGNYSNLDFWINGGTGGGQQLQVTGHAGGASQSTASIPALAANTWQHISIPLASLGVASRSDFDGFWIQNSTGSAIATFYVDDIVLTTNSGAPSGAPVIALTTPANGASFAAPASITLAATVTTNGHTINKVQFYGGSVLLAEDAAPPYTYAWTNVAIGGYGVQARLVYDGASTLDSTIANITVTGTPAAAPGAYTLRIAVDQFGYLPELTKVAVISDPQTGYNAGVNYTPGATLQVRTWDSNTVVYSGSPTAWNGGATHTQSGDRAWWFDFTSVTNWGDYYIFDPANGTRSARFRIAQNVYETVAKQAGRMFYYQRRGAAKTVPYTDARWADGTNFMGPLQDSHCRLVSNPVAGTEKDLRGGWFDAGDYNKYVTWTDSLFSDLFFAYQQNPLIWPDDWNIPESGNGIPDLLDEIKWELDWVLRMQNANGSVLSKMGANGGSSPPSATADQVFYGAESTSATLSAAGSFAHAVRVYRSVGMTNYANTLSNAAVTAYNWAVANPAVLFNNAGFSSADPEVNDAGRLNLRIRAAIFLYDITGQAAYKTFVESNYGSVQAISSGWWGPYQSSIQDALLYYTTLPGVSTSVANGIRNSKQNSINGGDFYGAWTAQTDAYRAYEPDAQYDWGNNSIKSHAGILLADQLTYGLNPAAAAGYKAASAGYIHYIHGVNPFTMVYLSNMYDYGAENCVNEFYHTWFGNGTIWDNALTSPNGPPPGYLPGGANKNFAPDASYSGPRLAPPMDQPPQKSYKDWNTSWPEDSWEVTEPDILYQAAYLFLLSKLVHPLSYSDWTTGYGLTGAAANPTADPDGDGVQNLMEYAFNLSPQTNDAPALPQFSLQPWASGPQTNTFLTVQFPRQLGQSNLTYVVEASEDLVTWSSLFSATGTNTPAGPGFVSESGTAYLRQETVHDTAAVETSIAPRFVRFRLVLN
ncbi:MAG: glycoside hydrolase family 9 protein [Verrucomicrobiota bacterium]